MVALGRAAGSAAGGCGCGAGAGAGRADDPGRGRARHHPAGVERHGASARRRSGRARRRPCRRCLPRRLRARRTRSAVVFEERSAELRRARRPRQPPGASSAGPRRRARVLVGVCAERSLEMVVGLLGILKAGGAYLPLDPDYPRERLAGMVSDAGLRVVLMQGALAAVLPLPEGVAASCSTAAEFGVAQPFDCGGERCRRWSDLHPGHLAYMIYTSGSTGKPKGAAQHARGSAQPSAVDAGRLWADGRRRGAAEDAVQLRRFGVGVLLAADRGGAAGGG